MTIKELKKAIEENSLKEVKLIFKYDDTDFLCWQYVRAIADEKNLEITPIEDLSLLDQTDSFFGMHDSLLYVYTTDKLDKLKSFPNVNLVIICKELTKDLKLETIDFPKLTSWQVEDYVELRLPGLDDKQREWLCKIANYNIDRIANECDKLSIFEPEEQQEVFKLMNNDNAFCDLNPLNIFNYSNALLQRDYYTLNSMLADIQYLDIEATGLVTIMLKNIRGIIDIQLNPSSTVTSTGLNPKQYAMINRYRGKFTDEQLINIYDFLINIDAKLKNGDYQFRIVASRENNNQFVAYLTCHILGMC